ncbi:hypothetical protein V6N11_079233 [Hibiscus sabdariffa]|uniref:F-box domain-containing protein n=1 Tax=Hibiscus sabdariffa TaxID=183260 RepID=A0ABR2RV55_9ROSI
MSDYLHEAVILEILKRLPVKSPVRFRSVCKTWNSIICGTCFISTHLQSSLSDNTPFLLLEYWINGKENYSLHYDNDGFDEFKQLQLPVFGCVSRTAVLDSCNGVTAIPPNYTFDDVTVAIDIKVPFVNGVVHWLGYQTRNNSGFSNVILRFYFSAEEFMVINFPESLIGLWPPCLSIMKYGESSIAVSRLPIGDGLKELWVMKEYGVFESWTKVFTLQSVNPYESSLRLLGFRKNEEVLLQGVDGKLVSLDLNFLQMGASLYLDCQQIEFHGVEVEENLMSVNSYVESLVLLDKTVNV